MSRSYTEPSLCIPRVFSSITWHKVKEVIEGSDLGVVDRVDMVNKTNDKGDRFKRVFVHFKRWSMSDEAQAVRQRIMDGEEVKIVYDEPWFWKVYKSYAPRPERRTTTTSRDNKHSSRSSRSKPKIVVEHDNERRRHRSDSHSSHSSSYERPTSRRHYDRDDRDARDENDVRKLKCIIDEQARIIKKLKAQLGAVDEEIGALRAEVDEDADAAAEDAGTEETTDNKYKDAGLVQDWASPDGDDDE